jgi:asparagine synthetase B (glutamine-hydrolysing)
VSTIEVHGELNRNFAWDGTKLCNDADFEARTPPPYHLRGAASSVRRGPAASWRILRDPLGLNKLFWAQAGDGHVDVAARPRSLIDAGHHLDQISAIPRGCVVDVSPGNRRSTAQSILPSSWSSRDAQGGMSVQDAGDEIRTKLDSYLTALAAAYPSAPVFVCLSGGLDSSGVAALARAHFRDVTAVSFDLGGLHKPASQDRVVALRLAHDFNMPLLEVTVTENQLLQHIDTVLVEGIDWRDFNVHAGLVNAALAAGIAAARPDGQPAAPTLVLTGDLANEFLVDYHSERYRDTLYYELPRLPAAALRTSLVRGLDTCHREVGVFAAWGLSVVQPYAVVADAYLSLGDDFLASGDRKEQLCRHIFGTLIPEYVYSRPKVRAQAGSPEVAGGVLAACVDRGLDKNWLRQRFAHLHSLIDASSMDRFIRAGCYRSAIPTLAKEMH